MFGDLEDGPSLWMVKTNVKKPVQSGYRYGLKFPLSFMLNKYKVLLVFIKRPSCLLIVWRDLRHNLGYLVHSLEKFQHSVYYSEKTRGKGVSASVSRVLTMYHDGL